MEEKRRSGAHTGNNGFPFITSEEDAAVPLSGLCCRVALTLHRSEETAVMDAAKCVCCSVGAEHVGYVK